MGVSLSLSHHPYVRRRCTGCYSNHLTRRCLTTGKGSTWFVSVNLRVTNRHLEGKGLSHSVVNSRATFTLELVAIGKKRCDYWSSLCTLYSLNVTSEQRRTTSLIRCDIKLLGTAGRSRNDH